MKKIIVIGGGPAGLSAAIAAAGKGAGVTVLEKMQSPGRKLLASGNGRCNFSNILRGREFAEKFEGDWRAVLPAVEKYPNDHLVAFLASMGAPESSPDGFHFFPKSGRAGDVLNAFLKECGRLGVKILTGQKAERLAVEDGRVTGVVLENGETMSCESVVVACGGKSYPATGSDGGGYSLAASAGHTVVEPTPALSALNTKGAPFGGCAGNTLENAEVLIDAKGAAGRQRHIGQLLFTHDGISGPPVLDISGRVTRLLLSSPEVRLRMRIDASLDEAFWRGTLDNWRKMEGHKLLRTLLSASMTRSFAEALLASCGIPSDRKMCALKKEEERKLLDSLANGVPLVVDGCPGFEKAMATNGGVSMRQINSRTMESKLAKGLYFAGEILDVNPPCGGYHIQWCYSSGMLAGENAAG